MALELTGLAIVNAGYLAVGVAALASMGWLTRSAATWHRLGVAYPAGLTLVTVPAAYLALAGVPVSITATVAGAAVLVLAARRCRPRPRLRALAAAATSSRRRPSPEAAVGIALGLVVAAVVAYALRTFVVRPVIEWDSWVIWMSKARLLYADPSLAPAALRSGDYGQSAYPIGLPTIEALGFSAMGRFDGTAIGVQFWLLLAAFPVALWSLLSSRVRSWAIAAAALAVVASPQLLYQLLTRYADVPLGLFVALGLAAGAAWAVSEGGETWLLACFALFLGMAGITKSEGELFALAGAVALLVAVAVSRDRRRVRPAASAVGALLLIVLPWRLYCAVYGLSTPDYSLGNALRPSYLGAHADRVGPTLRELWHQLVQAQSWGLLTWVILVALLAAAAWGRWRVAAFALTWLALAFGGLVLTYWISVLPTSSHLTNSSYRTIVSLLIGGAALVPLLAFPVRRPST